MSVHDFTITTSRGAVPALYAQNSSDRNAPLVIYHSGYCGEKEGLHAQRLKTKSEEAGVNFLAFDNLGHGASPVPLGQADLSAWIQTSREIIENNPASAQNLVLVGNSFGANIAFEAARQTQNEYDDVNILGFLGISSAPDVILREVHHLLQRSMDDEPSLKQQFNAGSTVPINIPSAAQPITISKEIIEDAETHQILGSEKKLSCRKAFLIHGKCDRIVPYTRSLEFALSFDTEMTTITLTDGQHALNSDSDLEEIDLAFDRLIAQPNA